MKKITAMTLSALLFVSLAGCSAQKEDKTAQTSETAPAAETEVSSEAGQEIDYMVLVNKLNPLPDYWESSLETMEIENSLGDKAEVEKEAGAAYLALKADLEEEGVFIDIDSARRSVEDQQRIMDEFTAEYGADYAAKTVAAPGYSEHHTGLAVDLYLNIDGEDVYLNEDMVQYPEVWEKIHAKLADHGFILRYLEDKEHITGYGYEPWHIRYIRDKETAKEIMDKGLTLEEYLGAVESYETEVDLRGSELFSEEELAEAAVQVKCKFAGFDGCQLHNIRYGGDEENNEENLAHVKEVDEGADYVEVIKLLTDFRTGPEGSASTFEPDTEIKDYGWLLAREKDGNWQLVDFGY